MTDEMIPLQAAEAAVHIAFDISDGVVATTHAVLLDDTERFRVLEPNLIQLAEHLRVVRAEAITELRKTKV